jgi:hypothetical protein
MHTGRRWLWLVSLAGAVGCAHGGPDGLAAEEMEVAYQKVYRPSNACRPDDATCCAELAGAAQVAGNAGESARAAQLWHTVALSCPARREEAGAAVLAASRRGPGAAAPDGRLVNVNYRTRLSPAIRLFWVGTSVGPSLTPVAGTAANQPVRVEVQAIRFAGGRAGPLVTASRDLDVPFEAGTTVTVEIAEGGDAGTLAISTHVDRIPAPRSLPARPPEKRATPVLPLEKARPLVLDVPRAPFEFGAALHGVRPALRLCLDREGQVDTVRFLEQAHPRLVASTLDMLRDAHYQPYRVGDQAVPSCETTRGS